MIRKFTENDTDRIMQIWLQANIDAHSFIPADYWNRNFEYVKEEIIKAEIYVYEIENEPVAFVGLADDYIAGIFVECRLRSKGIGKELIAFAKQIKKTLRLHVYSKNARAVAFYKKEGFAVVCEQMDSSTGEPELEMIWKNA